MVHGLLKYHLLGHELWITTTHVSLLIVSLIIVILSIAINRKIKKVNPEDTPGVLQNVAELAVEMLDNLVDSIMGGKGKKYANYIGTVFMFILFCNLSGLIGMRPPTADYGVTFALGLMTFLIIHYTNIRENKADAFKRLFQPMPFLFPINLIGELATPFSMSLRLFGNILSGTVMLALVYGLLPVFVKFGIPSVLHVYFDIFAGAIQTYVFCMLTMVFVTNKMATEE
ncbi:F0F1 ATP synthase subunit A [Konateibacter massiliensis]|uniref:F0F1 ATP synthase subunit A n=1 Tax=Konateibacter massiliensis TaxID=2002841 RepID=UPI000C1562B0|nr:F0F1 ATP synthase subunit A [Konateibacter massiliensis]